MLYLTNFQQLGEFGQYFPLNLKKGLLRSTVPDGTARIFLPDKGGPAGHTLCMAEDAREVRREKATPGRRKRRKQET